MRKIFNIDQLDAKQMPIIGFSGPSDEMIFNDKIYPSLKTDKIFAMYKDSGINIFMNSDDDYAYRSESVIKTLDFCKKYGLYYIVYDTSLFNNNAFRDKEIPLEINYQNIEKHFREYATNNNCAGVFVIDEPNKDCLYNMKDVIQAYKTQFDKLNIKRFCYSNLLPWNKNSGSNEIEYDDYLEKAIREGGSEYLCYDFYPFVSSELHIKDNISPGIYNLVAQVGRIARNHDLPFMAFVQLGGNWTDDPMYSSVRRPTPNEIIWMVNVYLAFGVKGICYFIPFQCKSFLKFLPHGGQTGIITPEGEKSNLFEPVKIANTQINSVDEYLLFCELKQVIVFGPMPSEIEYDKVITYSHNFNELVHISGDAALIGCFEYFGRTALYVVNNSLTDDAEINLYFDKNYSFVTYDLFGQEQSTGKKISLFLLPGYAKLIIL